MLIMHKYDIWQWWSDGLTQDIETSLSIPSEREWMHERGKQLDSYLT